MFYFFLLIDKESKPEREVGGRRASVEHEQMFQMANLLFKENNIYSV